MWIVRLGLRRPYTFLVMAVLIAVLGVTAIVTMPVDIFPAIDIPVVSVVWTYSGISPEEMAERIVIYTERQFPTLVSDIQHTESQSFQGVGVIRVYFQPGVKIETAIAQITSTVQTILKYLPPGIFPPAVVKYDASSVPILQLSLHSKTLTEAELFDLGINFIRVGLATVQGAAIPAPFGGKLRQIMVDLDPHAMYAKGLSATDVATAVNAQNLILPAGIAKVGDREYLVRVNSSPDLVATLNAMPVKTVNGATVYVGDVAHVRDGYAVQTNIVRDNGSRAALIPVLKTGAASTLDVIRRVRETLPRILAGLPPALEVTPLFDQSIFVRASIKEVLREAAIAIALIGAMILLFLGSVRSALIVWISIPLSILTSLVALKALGETINVMTLGGLALAVGILVDDATVQVENLHRNAALGKTFIRAILDSADQIAVPAFVSTLSICIVFVPVLLLSGVAKYLFTPLAMAVVFAMLMSYVLTRTLVITMAHRLLREEMAHHDAVHTGPMWRVHYAFNGWFERVRRRYGSALAFALKHRFLALCAFAAFFIGSLAMAPMVGEDFFPNVDSGMMRLHVRAPQGTRIESTEHMFGQVEQEIRRLIPAEELDTILDDIGLPAGGTTSLALSDSPTIGDADGEILIALKEDHRPTEQYMRLLRKHLALKFPDGEFFFQAANITNEILNFGLPAPIDVQVVGGNAAANYELARDIERRMKRIPGAVDVHLHQEVEYPTVFVNVDRTKASQVGMTQRDVANSVLISLSGSGQTAPNLWLNPQNGVSYLLVTQTPPYRIGSFEDLRRQPITGPSADNVAGTAATPVESFYQRHPAEGIVPTSTGTSAVQLLGNLATLERRISPAVVSHYDAAPVMDVFAGVDHRDLGGVVREVRRILQDVTPRLAHGSYLRLRGLAETMQRSFTRLGTGIVFAIVLVYLLMAVNFQSWLDPFIILTALPGALAGIVWMLFVTQTTISVPSLMGAMMTVGVATANSILVVTFANDERMAGKGALEAAQAAGVTRFRPVLMTALAMIFGMLPMASGLGEGGEQNAPLGRAVIGGLLVATVTTLLFVPIVYSYLRKTSPVDFDTELAHEEAEDELGGASATSQEPGAGEPAE